MSDAARPRSTVTVNAASTLRVKPTLLLLLVPVRAEDATLEHGLARLKQICTETARRLTRLGATRVEIGDPYGDEHAEADPMVKMQAAAMRRHRKAEPAPAKRAGANAMVTGQWDISRSSAEELLLLVDRLRFEASVEIEEEPAAAEDLPWEDPQQQIRAMIEQATAEPKADPSPKFLYFARLSQESWGEAAAQLFEACRIKAERLAKAAGKRLGDMTALHTGHTGDARVDRHMDLQRSRALLARSFYQLEEGEFVSEEPQPAEVSVSLHVTYSLEGP